MKLKKLIYTITAGFMLTLAPAMALPVSVHAADENNQPCGNTPAAKEVLNGIDQVGDNCGDSRVNHIFKVVVQLLSLAVGIVSVIVIIYAGFKYITSAGAPEKISNAKSTLLYALVGLAVAALAQFMIHFILAKT